jgi:SnoaL-like protein
MAGEYAKLAGAEQPGVTAKLGGRMDAGEAIAREQIRDVISRYNHAGDRGDLETLVRCFREDGVLDLEDEDACAGRDAILHRLSRVVSDSVARAGRVFVRHHVSSVKIDVTGPDSATAASYFLVFTEIGLDHWGRYADRLARAGGLWQFAHRKVRLDGAAPNSRMAARRSP